MVLILPLLVGISLFQPAAAAPARPIAITIDDLPGWQPVNERRADETLSALAETLKRENAPATGFVIGNLATRTADSRKSLESWAKAGLPLANHSWNHDRYSKVEPKEFWAGVRKTEELLKPLREKYGPWPIAFRFPMLNQGNSPEHERLANEYFRQTGTLLAHVSIDNSDWAFARQYDDARKRKGRAQQKRIEDLFIQHILDCVAYAEMASEAIYARQIPQILLLHSNSLNVAKLGELIQKPRRRICSAGNCPLGPTG